MRRMSPDRPISELFAQKRPLRSLEFFPPKDDAGVEKELWQEPPKEKEPPKKPAPPKEGDPK